MDKYFKNTKLKALRPGLKKEILADIQKELPGQSIFNNRRFVRLYWSFITAAFVVLTFVNIYTNKTHENLMVTEYSACASADTECKLEMMRIAEAQGMFSNPIFKRKS
ncbi:MAG: hypothetical protein V1752_05550 [Candidatus Firestonebacteria bacterium]